MLDELIRVALGIVLRFLLFPVALVVCTPFILVRAVILAARHRMKFTHAIIDGYEAVDVSWWN